MKIFLKKALSLALALMIVAGTATVLTHNGVVFAQEDEKQEYTVGEIIEFGSYPQTLVTDGDLLFELNSLAKSWKSYGYYSGTGEVADGKMTASNYMKYSDIEYGEDRYRAVTFSKFRPYLSSEECSADNSYQDNNGYTVNTVYYFKYEPLKWRVLDKNGLVMSESILDNMAYNDYLIEVDGDYYGDPDKTVPSSSWHYSSLRAFLNEDFYNAAFSDAEKEQIRITALENKAYNNEAYDSENTYDKVFVLTLNDIKNTAYGFNKSISVKDTERTAKGTDYAKCQGLYVSTADATKGFSPWRLRTVYDDRQSLDVRIYGDVAYAPNYNNYYGIRPVVRIGGEDQTPEKVTGKCGENAEYSFDLLTGELVISGTGDTYDFDSETSRIFRDHADSFELVMLVKKVTVEEGITSIGSSFFANMFHLSQISLPNGLKKINGRAFSECLIESIDIPEGLTHIGVDAFAFCRKLERITIPDSVTYIESDILRSSAYYENEANWENDALYVGKHLIAVKDTAKGDFTIKDGTKCIAGSAFYGCKELTNIIIPDSVVGIGEFAFRECTNVSTITIPDSVSRIGNAAFMDMGYYNNESNWENNALYIGKRLAASKHEALSGDYTVKDGTKWILDGAFLGCENLTSVVLPDTVESIGNEVFSANDSITVVIPRSVTYIGEKAFYYCESVYIKCYLNSYAYNYAIENGFSYDLLLEFDKGQCGDNAYFQFDKNTGEVVVSGTGDLWDSPFGDFSNFPDAVTITIEPGITGIGYSVFRFCDKLETVTIPDTLTSIGEVAFYYCRNLKTITIPVSVTNIGESAFDGCENLTIKCCENSEAHKYAVANEIPFELIVPEVPAAVPVSLILDKKPTKIAYELNEEFDPSGAIIRVKYSDGTIKPLTTDDVEIVGFDTTTGGSKKVHFSYTENGVTLNTWEFTHLVDRQVTAIFIPHKPNKTTYVMGEPFEREGMQIIATYSDGTKNDVSNAVRTSGYESTSAGLKKMTVHYTYKGKEVTLQFSYQMNPKLRSITLTKKPTKLASYKVGEPLSKEGMIITANFSDGTTKDVTHLIRTSGYSSKQVGKQIITVSYTYGTQTKSVQFSIIMSQT